MKTKKLAKEAAKKRGNLPYDLTPFLPGNDNIGPLKDMAQEITAASAVLEGKVATDTASELGGQLRLINSYYSNLIEGHKPTILDIEMALRKEFNRDPDKKYAQELCAAHVETETAAWPVFFQDFICLR